ncbi:MAG TPA: hypothetical protein VEI06_17770 [Gemmatimonadaceae bacterium]|nr:hypothetical protein [Gemmatimonadaceae bacterium]
MRRIRDIVIGALCIGLLAGCTTSTGSGPLTCNLTTSPSGLGDVDISVTYSASGTGDGSISSLTYATNAGNVVVNNPTLPFNQQIQLSGGTQAMISANGKVTNGSLQIGYQATSGGGNANQSDSCQQST